MASKLGASVIVHKEQPQNVWTKLFENRVHESSVNSISWAPHEMGLILACASSDGNVSILEYRDDQWMSSSFQNDSLGCNSVSWAPYSALGSIMEDGSSVRRIVTGSCDNSVRIWAYNMQLNKWQEESRQTSPHKDWVRDVAWAPNTAMPYNIIASCSEDRSVYIWKQIEKNGMWTSILMNTFDAPVWRVSWSVTGNVLAVSTGDHKVTLWKQSVTEEWAQISSVEDETPSN